MLSPQGAVSVFRRPLLKSEKWRTRLLKMCFRTLSERFLVSLPVGPIGAITKQGFFCFSLSGAVMGESLARRACRGS